MKCRRCKAPAVVKLPSHHAGFCPDCFQLFFTRQVEKAIRKHKMFTFEDRVLVCLSGGKDSLALMHVLKQLGYDVTGLHIDLSIPGSSDRARRTVEDFCEKFGCDLRVVEMAEESIAIPDVKAAVNRPICSACGKIKRYYFNKTAIDEGYDVLATGHNLDDEVARLFSNTLRWDSAYLSDQGPMLPSEGGFRSKVRPLYRMGEFEMANYCFLNDIDYHTAPCPYSTGASFTFHKELLAQLEEEMPGQKLAFYENFLKNGRPAFEAVAEKEGAPLAPCVSCGYPTSAETCGVCRLRAAVAEKAGA